MLMGFRHQPSRSTQSTLCTSTTALLENAPKELSCARFWLFATRRIHSSDIRFFSSTVNPPLSGSGTAADFLTNAKNANPATATTAPASTSSAATGSATNGTPSPTASAPSAGFASAGVEAVVLAGFVALSIGSALLY